MNSIIPTTKYRICLQLCLLVPSLWVGPIPIGHSHVYALDSRSGADGLVQHLLRHHSGGSCNSVGCKWHVHWVFRASGYAGIGGEASLVQTMSNSSVPSRERLDILVAEPLLENLAELPSNSRAGLTDGALSGANWLSGQSLYRISIPTFSSVMRC